MLHLAVDKELSYLNYLAIMSAVRYNDLTVWIKQEPSNAYWNIVKKHPSITFKEIDPVTGITLHYEDFTGKLDIIYIAECTKAMVNEYQIEHPKMYEVDGEFEAKDMCLVKVDKPELITPEYIETSNTALANLIKHVLLERVWNAKI
jgi:hypothetical protein